MDKDTVKNIVCNIDNYNVSSARVYHNMHLLDFMKFQFKT